MTFSQLRTFALVAELGSVRAAAAALGVSEPAVSAAVAALRADLGDPLFRRAGGGIELTPGGRALAVRARELVRLADRTRREVARSTATDRVRVLATASCAEHVAGALGAVLAHRVPRAAPEVAVGAAGTLVQALLDDDADVVLGPRPATPPGQEIDAVPFLRLRWVVVAGPGHPLAGRRRVALAELAGRRLGTGPAGLEPGTEEHCWARRAGRPLRVERLASQAAAVRSAVDGGGLALALDSAVRADLRTGALVRVPVEGTPVIGMWWAGVAAGGRATPAARAVQRFLTTPEATAALLAGQPLRDRVRPTVRVELWSGQAAEG